MQKRKWGRLKIGKKRILSLVLVVAMVVTSIPVSEWINGVKHAEARAIYEPQKLGISLMCADMLKGEYADDVYKAIVRGKSQKEDSLYGSPFNNVGMFGLTYENKHGGAGKAYYTDVKTNYSALYNLAKKGQIEQSICANAKNHKHASTENHWNKINQYNKIILGYPTDEKNNMFYCAHLFETKDNDDYSKVGGNDKWSEMKPDTGYKNREAVYLTAKKGCDTCSGAYVEKVSVALKDTVAPKITSVNISTDPEKNSASNATQYFNAGNTIYIRMQFSEYVRLADNLNTDASSQSTKLKLGVALSRGKTVDAQVVYANLYSLKGDTAVFSYKIPSTINDEKVDYFVERIADISKQGALISKKKVFNRVFLDNNGKTLFDTSSTTLAALKSAVGEDVYNNELKKTTSAITDLAGNPLNINDFRDINNKKSGPKMNRTYLDTVNPVVSSVEFLASPTPEANNAQEDGDGNDNANFYLKKGVDLTTKVVVNEKLKTLSSEELKSIKAILNIYVLGNTPSGVSITGENGRGYVTVKATGMNVDEKNTRTTIEFEPVTIAGNMHVDPIDTGTLKDSKDYKITIKSIVNRELLKDYADNTCSSDSDYRDETSKAYLLDNDAPTINVKNEQKTGSSKYAMSECGAKGEVYCIKLSALDEDKRSGNSEKMPYASGVIDGTGSVSIDFQCDEDLEFQYVLHDEAIADGDLSKYFKTGKTVSNNILIPEGDNTENPSEPVEFLLKSKESYVYLYLKFKDEIDYGAIKNGIKVTMNATDFNGNTATKDVYYDYNPMDKVPPSITYTKKELKKNESGSYQQATVYFNDPKSGVVRDDVRYVWVKEGESVPDVDQYETLPADKIFDSYADEPADTYCRAVINSPTVALGETYKGSLYMYIKDKKGNENVSGALCKLFFPTW